MANDLNSVALVGRLTKDVEVKTFPNGGSILNMAVAVNRSVKHGEEWVDEASYLDIRYSTKSIKIADYLKKGTQISIDGYLKQEKWEKGGKTNSKIVVCASNVQLLGSKPSNSGNGVPKEAQGVTNAFGGEAFPEDFPMY